MSNQKIENLPRIPSSAFTLDSEDYYTIVEREDGTLYKMLIKNALKTNQDSGEIVFLDQDVVIYTANDSITASEKNPIKINVNLSKHGVPSFATVAIITCFIFSGNYPRFDVSFGPAGQVRALRQAARAHHWSQQYMIPIENAKLQGTLKDKSKGNTFKIRFHGYA